MMPDTPLPGLDRDPYLWPQARHRVATVDYEFAGTLGGENVYACGVCGCLVRAHDEGDHTDFHQSP